MVLLLGLAQLSKIAGPFFLALNLMIVVWPVQRYLARRIPKLLASILSGLLAIFIIGLLFWGIGWAASLFVQEIPQYKGQFQNLYDQVLHLAGEYGITSTQIIEQLKSISPSSVVGVVSSLLSNVSGAVSLFVVVITVLLFMVLDSVEFESRLERLGQRHNPVLVLALNSFAKGVRKYWVTSTIFGLIVSTLTWAGLAAYGIPLAMVWAVLAFVTNYIPNVGFIIGLVPAAVMGLLAKGPLGAIFVIVLYGVLNFVVQGIIQPKVTGEAVGVTSTVSFLSLLVWAVVLGPLGALLALPATLFVKALVVDSDPDARWINALIASNPKTSSEEPLLGDDRPRLFNPAFARKTQTDDPVADQPRRSLDITKPEEDENDAVAVAPRRSATELDDDDYQAVYAISDEATEEDDKATEEGSAAEEGAAFIENQAPTDETADAPTPDLGLLVDPERLADEEDHGFLAEEADPEETPRRAHPEDDSQHSNDDSVPTDDSVTADSGPVFQKSATPPWTGAFPHGDD